MNMKTFFVLLAFLAYISGAYAHSEAENYGGEGSGSTPHQPKSGTKTYSTFTGRVLTNEEYKTFAHANVTATCSIKIKDCNSDEGRRLDGSCNNLKNPQKGTQLTLVKRVLPAVYGKKIGEPRPAKSGKALPLSRVVRTKLVAEGQIPSNAYTQMLPNFWIFMTLDGTLSQDTLNYVIYKPYCCKPEGKKDSLCAPNPIPCDDPVHRFSEVRCMNMTKPTTYQNQGCVAKSKVTSSDRINLATPLFDLSFLYGGVPSASLAARQNENGLLRFEVDEEGRIWPPSITDNPKGTCRLNQEPAEVRCNETPVMVSNTLLGANLMTIWMWRQHNMIAQGLAEVNPQWDDERLFMTARDINIALATQILYYEMYPLMMGRKRMEKDGIISAETGFRDLYDKTVLPAMTHEYLYALRWVHTIQEGTVKQYDSDGNYMKQIPYGNLTYRTGYLGVDGNMESITQGVFRQPCAHADHVVDPNVAEAALGELQRSLDLLTNDNMKNRFLGLPPYVKYLKHCTGKTYATWDDLCDHIEDQNIEALKNVYESVQDVELLAGIWLEKPLPNAPLPPTAYCLVKQQLIHNVKSDRHWYERADRPNAFNEAQLAEIRKMTVARFLCNVADGVSCIQAHAFKKISAKNPMVACEEIPTINFSAWACKD